MGDAYMELDNVAEAAASYVKAAANDNTFTSPFYLLRAGMAYEMAGDYAKAIAAYNRIKADYPNSNEGFSIELNSSGDDSILKETFDRIS